MNDDLYKIGSLCSIWDPDMGDSAGNPLNWLHGIIVDERYDHEYGGMRYHVMWCDGKRDNTWYTWDAIDPRYLPVPIVKNEVIDED